jgi:hypothetical protein
MLSQRKANELNHLSLKDTYEKITRVICNSIEKLDKARKVLKGLERRRKKHRAVIKLLSNRLSFCNSRKQNKCKHIRSLMNKKHKLSCGIHRMRNIKLYLHETLSNYMIYWKKRKRHLVFNHKIKYYIPL